MNNYKKEEVKEIIFNLNLKYTDEDKINIQKLIDTYFRKKNLPNSKVEFIVGSLLWIYSRINFLFEDDINWSQKEIAKKLSIKPKSISRLSSNLMDKMKICIFDERFARKEIIKKNPLNDFVMTKEGFIVDKKFIENQMFEHMKAKFGNIIDIKPEDEVTFSTISNNFNETKDTTNKPVDSKNKKLGEFFGK